MLGILSSNRASRLARMALLTAAAALATLSGPATAAEPETAPNLKELGHDV